jgi:hypothetical protein
MVPDRPSGERRKFGLWDERPNALPDPRFFPRRLSTF